MFKLALPTRANFCELDALGLTEPERHSVTPSWSQQPQAIALKVFCMAIDLRVLHSAGRQKRAADSNSAFDNWTA